MAEWLKAHAWKACVGQPTVGSNPTLSAIPSAVAEMMARRQSQTPRFGPLRRLRAIRVSAVHRSRRARCVADVSVLAGFMSERATGTAFDIHRLRHTKWVESGKGTVRLATEHKEPDKKRCPQKFHLHNKIGPATIDRTAAVGRTRRRTRRGVRAPRCPKVATVGHAPRRRPTFHTRGLKRTRSGSGRQAGSRHRKLARTRAEGSPA